jgi:polysaccharide export outer membrane protein
MHELKIFLMTVLTASLCACAATAPQTAQPDAGGPLSGPAATVADRKGADEQLAELQAILAEPPPPFRLGQGDVVSVTVLEEPDLSVERTAVRPDGLISVPLAGEVTAAGRPVSDLTGEITTRLERYVIDPKVNVRVEELRSVEYLVYGAVVNPGTFPLDRRTTISAAIARAGGLQQGNYRASTIEIADLRHAFIARDGRALPVDFVQLLREGDLRFDIELRPGDGIYIPSGLSQEVYVLGEVSEPMVFAYQDHMPLSRVLSMSEGFTPDGDITRIHVIRGSLGNPTVIASNFRDVLAGRERDVSLEPGDIIYVPPKTLTSFSRIMDKILPSLLAVQNAALLGRAASN